MCVTPRALPGDAFRKIIRTSYEVFTTRCSVDFHQSLYYVFGRIILNRRPSSTNTGFSLSKRFSTLESMSVGLSMAVLYSEATDPEGVKLPDPVLEEELERSAKQGAGRF